MSSPMEAHSRSDSRQGSYILITGGAGFVGANLADAYLRQGQRVLILDNLSRHGVKRNLNWLKQRHGQAAEIQIADVRDTTQLRQATLNAEAVFHLAGQVAVTTSLQDPVSDFQINSLGTLNLLEALRAQDRPVPLIFTSTNKVYGKLDDLCLHERSTRYVPDNLDVAQTGISEERSIHFQSPYGCSKGAADQYVLDYASSYGMPALVFRMSCIYGPLQCGSEDQGWVAHFVNRVLDNQDITIYGNGKQVRDLLFIDDLISAFQIAIHQADYLAGQVFNIGGGPRNSVSLLELIAMLEDLCNRKVSCRFDEWRQGDQQYYISNFRKFADATGWRPTVDVIEGIRRLYWWMSTAQERLVLANTEVDAAKVNGHTTNGNHEWQHDSIVSLPGEVAASAGGNNGD